MESSVPLSLSLLLFPLFLSLTLCFLCFLRYVYLWSSHPPLAGGNKSVFTHTHQHTHTHTYRLRDRHTLTYRHSAHIHMHTNTHSHTLTHKHCLPNPFSHTYS